MQTAHESVTPPVCCTTCSFSCYSHKQLLQHCKLVHKYTCEPCGKSFSSFSGCQTHNKVHHGTGDNLWSCKTCGKKYVAVSRLEIHERSHSDSRPFICVTCDKTYKHKKDLLGHTCLMAISRFALRDRVTLRLLKLPFWGKDVVEWSMALAVRLSDWCCSESMV